MGILHMLSGPLIGAVIGYCTNYIAVKMLFRPLRAVKIGRYTLPFTPGLIPKRKDALAVSAGRAVGASLLTEDMIASMLTSEAMEASVTDLCMKELQEYLDSQRALKEEAGSLIGQEVYDRGRAALKEKLAKKIMENVEAMEPGKIVEEEGKKAVRQKLEGTMFSMLLSNRLLDSLAAELGEYTERYILENGPDYVDQALEKEISGLEEKPLSEIGEWVSGHDQALRVQIRNVYRKCIVNVAQFVAQQLHISEMVENKIREMDVLEMETLVLSVMKQELGMIVNLGALIGFVLGIFNLLF